VNIWPRERAVLLVPYACFLLLLSTPYIFHYVMTGRFSAMRDFLFNALLGGPFLKGWFATFWFVTCLFVAQQIFNLIIVTNSNITQLIAAAASLLAAYANEMLAPDLNAPGGVNVALMAFPMLYAGYRLRNWRPSALSTIAAFSIAAASSVAAETVSIGFDMKYTIYGIPLVSIGIAYAWFISLSFVSRVIANFHHFKSVLSALGRVSLGIMFVHESIQTLLQSSMHLNNETLRFLVAITLSSAVSLLLERFSMTNSLLLGNPYIAPQGRGGRINTCAESASDS
jgi:Fucose 4-O-acetylase and related acetyltransferases